MFCFLLLVTQDRSFQQLSNNNTLQPRKITNLRRLEYQVLLKLEERSSFFSCQNQNGSNAAKSPNTGKLEIFQQVVLFGGYSYYAVDFFPTGCFIWGAVLLGSRE